MTKEAQDRIAPEARATDGAAAAKIPPSFTDIWQEHERWSYETFGGPEIKGPLGPIIHLGKEQKELLANPEDRLEYADCMFLIMDAARRQGLGLEGLLQAMADKQAILWRRNYRPDPDNPDQPVEHDRSNKTGPDKAESDKARNDKD